MINVLDIRLASSGRFNAVRRIEYVALLLMAVFLATLHGPFGALAAGPLIVLALMLVPGKEEHATRERLRLTALNELLDGGLALRARWREIEGQPLSDANGLARWSIQRDVLLWISGCQDRLKRYPEVAGIFAAHAYSDDVIEELDACVQTLSKLRRLMGLSERLSLPI